MSNEAKTMRAVGKLLAWYAKAMAESTVTAANEIIDVAPLLRVWRPGKHAAGDVVTHDGAPYRCIQPHDSTDNPGWSPDATPAMWTPYHATDATHALPWQAPTGAQDAYKAGEWMRWTDGKSYRCEAETAVWGPDTRPEDWAVETET